MLIRDETGMTLPELLVSMTVGLIVLFAGALLLDRSVLASNTITDRQDAFQRGRAAMEDMTRKLRSQVCLGENADPIVYGDGTKVTFYADLGDGTTVPEKRTFTWDSSTKQINEDIYVGTGVYPDLTFPGTPTTTRHVVSKVGQIVQGTPQPIFRYFAADDAGVIGTLDELPVPLSSADAPRVIMVKIAFVVFPERTVMKDPDATTLLNDVWVRLADPSKPSEGPRCL